ncbi:MAG: hypothetical protein AAGA28_14745 [Pseudomonadota bacterium]
MAGSQNAFAAAFVEGFNAHPTDALIRNAATTMELHDWGGVHLPLTINSGEPNGTFVCSPRVAWTDFIREELTRFPRPWLVPAIRAVVRGVELLTRRSDLDRIVHVNNWMMSTNLPSGIDPALCTAQTDRLAACFPEHILAMRSLTERHSGPLMTALRASGWLFLPARQVYILDDVARQGLTRRDSRSDAKLWKTGRFKHGPLQTMSERDAERIADLYRLLYIEKYTPLNPQYTPRFVRFAHDIGLLRFFVLRDAAGDIQATGGIRHLGEHAAMPFLGYNTALDQTLGLYRLACHAGSLYAAQHGLRLNKSSGATLFKRTRGATAEMEYTAFYIRHLPRNRQRPFAALELIAKHVGIPILQRYAL